MRRSSTRRRRRAGLLTVSHSSFWPVLLLLALASPLCGGCHGNGASIVRATRDFPAGTGFVKHQVTVDGKTHAVWVFIPRNYDPKLKYPTIVFLHGLFECGSDGSAGCLSAGLGPVVAKRAPTWPFITIFPQSTGTWRGADRERLVLASLDWAQQNYAVDSDRVILAGLSYGALGTWEIGGKHTDRFAALVPVSGHRATELIERLMVLPVWAFDYKGDPIVSSASSEQMCEKIRAEGGTARLTEFAGIGHDCWPLAVADSDLVDWMLKQRRRHDLLPGPPHPPMRVPDAGSGVARVE